MHPEQFYKMLETSDVYPSTAQPAYKEFYNRYNYLSTHYKSILSIHISNKLSGTWQNSLNAAKKVEEESGKTIKVINSNRVSNALGLIVLRAARALEQGMLPDEISTLITKWSEKTNVLVSAKSMKYMIKSGTVSKSKGVIGSVLNIKPVVTMDSEGKTAAFGKPFTFKQSMKMVMNEFKKFIDGKKVWGYAISHADNLELANWYAQELEKITGMKPEFIQHASPVLVTNVGTGVVAVTVMLD